MGRRRKMARAIDANELLGIERLLDTDVVRQSKTASWLLDQVLHDIQAMPTLTQPNEWVSVENAVPDPGERVLATDGTFVGEAYRTSANTWYRHTGFPWRDCLQSIVTLWMPLPTVDKDNHVPAKAPNEPLTIEQLREMKDEPAYLKVFDPLLKSGWHIIKAVTKDKIIFRGWQTVYVPIDGMGVNYNLYRRPPEGEEET